MAINPSQLNFYKGSGGKFGAVQFSFQRPHFYLKSNPKMRNYDGRYIPDSWKTGGATVDDLIFREGAVFIEITSATGKDVYDWENKIIMAMSVNDMGKMLTVIEGVNQSVDIQHDPGAKSDSAGKIQKKLLVSSPKGIATGVLLNASIRKDDKLIKHMVPLSTEDVKILSCMLRVAIPAALAWV